MIEPPVDELCWNPTLDDAARGRLLDLWVRATNAGGAVGFLAPVTPDEVAPVLTRVLGKLAPDGDQLLVARVDEMPVGWLVVQRDRRPFAAHWRTVNRVQVDPEHQGRGIGRAMLDEVARRARDEWELEFLLLSYRGGTGLDRFYGRLGYEEIARIPGALRVAPGDDRDEVFVRLTL